MSLEQGTKLRKGKIIDSLSEENTSINLVMAESNTSYSADSNDISDNSSQLPEMKENYERKISELQSEFNQLKDLMVAVIKKSSKDSPSTSS